MFDLVLALVALLALSSGLLFLSARVAVRGPKWMGDIAAIAVVALAVVYICELWYDARLAQILPWSSLVVLGNWFLPLAAALSGFALAREPSWMSRKCLLCVLMIGVAGYSAVQPMIGQPPECSDQWTLDGYCLQTTDQTCTPACAASLLRSRGIAATESEMAELCLTREGTTWLGLYRGLKLKTQGSRWKVRVLTCSAEQLLTQTGCPMILSVGVERGAVIDSGYEHEDGWQPGRRHSVILLGRDRLGHANIADPNPTICRERWSIDDLNVLYRGPAIQLVPKQ